MAGWRLHWRNRVYGACSGAIALGDAPSWPTDGQVVRPACNTRAAIQMQLAKSNQTLRLTSTSTIGAPSVLPARLCAHGEGKEEQTRRLKELEKKYRLLLKDKLDCGAPTGTSAERDRSSSKARQGSARRILRC